MRWGRLRENRGWRERPTGRTERTFSRLWGTTPGHWIRRDSQRHPITRTFRRARLLIAPPPTRDIPTRPTRHFVMGTLTVCPCSSSDMSSMAMTAWPSPGRKRTTVCFPERVRMTIRRLLTEWWLPANQNNEFHADSIIVPDCFRKGCSNVVQEPEGGDCRPQRDRTSGVIDYMDGDAESRAFSECGHGIDCQIREQGAIREFKRRAATHLFENP